jgi:iron complex transport system substrate-binding protein
MARLTSGGEVLLRFARGLIFALLLAALLPLGSLVASAHDGPHDATPVPATPTLPVTVTDANGQQVEVTDVSRIIPLNGVTAEIIWDLGLGQNIVGVDVTATYPEDFKDVPSIGFGRQLSAEGILSLNPTLVIGDTTAGPPEVLDQIRQAGVTVVITKEYTDLQAPFEKIDAISAALGVPEAGAALKAKVQGEYDDAIALAKTATSHPRVLFIYIRGTSTLLIGGAGSGADTLIDAAGGVDAGTEAGIQGYAPVTAEALVAAAPDVILVMNGGLQSIGGIDGLMQIPGVSETPAGQNGAILSYDDQYLLGLGPRLGEMLMDLTYDLHPELERPATPEATPGVA